VAEVRERGVGGTRGLRRQRRHLYTSDVEREATLTLRDKTSGANGIRPGAPGTGRELQAPGRLANEVEAERRGSTDVIDESTGRPRAWPSGQQRSPTALRTPRRNQCRLVPGLRSRRTSRESSFAYGRHVQIELPVGGVYAEVSKGSNTGRCARRCGSRGRRSSSCASPRRGLA
jgi:hypothetical protein